MRGIPLVASAAVLCLLACAARPATAYRPSAQQQWTDHVALYADPDEVMLGGRGRTGGGAKKIAPEDKKLLDQALDAFQQASHLEKELKKSERAVSDQTKELKTELAKAKATAASTGQTRYFRREERLDEELMRQAESETRRDKRLVSQAETEMKGDKKFLQQAYGIVDIDAYETQRKAKGDDQCTAIQHCHQAKDMGLAPDKCVIGAGLCPRIQCYDYSPKDWCASKQVCATFVVCVCACVCACVCVDVRGVPAEVRMHDLLAGTHVHFKSPVLSPKPAHSHLSHLSEMCLRNVHTNLSAAPPEQACALQLKRRAHARTRTHTHAHARWQASSHKASHRSARIVQVCQKSATARKHCFPKGPGRKAYWLKKTCSI